MKKLIFLLITLSHSWAQSINSYNPITYYFNSAFDVSQNQDYFSQDHFLKNHETLFKRISSPIHSIKKDGGWGKFFEDEFLKMNAVPNYTLHLIGGGYDFHLLVQYYTSRQYPIPSLWATLTCYAGHLGNEAIELSNSNISSHDHLADIFVFDVAAKMLFSNEAVFEFFHDDVQLRTWHHQPIFNLKDSHIFNAGLNYVARPKLMGESWRPFVYTGMQILGGISYLAHPKTFISVGAGMAISDPFEQKGRLVTAAFYDTDDSLAISLFINGSDNFRARLNLYPTFFQFHSFDLGTLIALDRQNMVALGINLNMPLGLGINAF